jgi:poly(hydroxyalkanoate) depolymerase family esterase
VSRRFVTFPAEALIPRQSATRRVTAHGAVLLLAAALSAVVAAPVARAAAVEEVTGFGSNPGNLQMFRHVPGGFPAGRPLVVALHGCTQAAASYGVDAGWIELAEEWKFALLLPQQKSANNSSSCFNWFEIGDTTRGQGEALSIKQMVDRMKTDYGIDATRVYVTGLSAGGAMTAVMLATYPDVFAGGGVVAGVPYRCATSTSGAFTCMNPGVNLTPKQWGDKVRLASSHTGPWPTFSIWHGTSDVTVVSANLNELVEQWTDVHGTDQIADVSDSVAGYSHKVYKNVAGRPVVESYEITGMGHGQPVDPGTSEQQCGNAAAYILDVNICAAYHMGLAWGLNGATPPPGGGTTVTLTNIQARDGTSRRMPPAAPRRWSAS